MIFSIKSSYVLISLFVLQPLLQFSLAQNVISGSYAAAMPVFGLVSTT